MDVRDNSGSVTPLFLAAKHQNIRLNMIKQRRHCLSVNKCATRPLFCRAAKRLIEEGANINGKVGKTDKMMRQEEHKEIRMCYVLYPCTVQCTLSKFQY